MVIVHNIKARWPMGLQFFLNLISLLFLSPLKEGCRLIFASIELVTPLWTLKRVRANSYRKSSFMKKFELLRLVSSKKIKKIKLKIKKKYSKKKNSKD